MSGSIHPKSRKPVSPDWFVQGILTKIGDIFDRLTGRGWKPSSSLATSELIERMKTLLDAEARENGNGRRVVPHNITLKMQWDKFSTDSDKALTMLRNEFLTAAVDHINDRHYYTSAPLNVDIRPDYFTSGVKLIVGFDKFSDEEREASIDVSGPRPEAVPESDLKKDVEIRSLYAANLVFLFSINGKPQRISATLETGVRLSLGRTKENDIAIDDISISKYHGTFYLSNEGKLLFADTGSTNGTFLNGKRITSGKAYELGKDDQLVFGSVNVKVEVEIKVAPPEVPFPDSPTEAFTIGDITFTTKPVPAGSRDQTNSEDSIKKPEDTIEK
jgi:hypothetical protein